MHQWKSLLRALLLVLVFSNIQSVHALAYGQNTSDSVTGSYILDSQPEEIWFLSLTQTGQVVNGYALVVEPDEAGVLSQQQLSVSGTTDGTYLALTIGDLLFGSISMTGAKEGDDLVLTFPTDEGGLGTAVFTETSPEQFNEALTNWRNMGSVQDWLGSLLLTEADMPPGMLLSNESSLSRTEAAAAYPYVDANQFEVWEWMASVDRIFSSSGTSEAVR